MRWLSYLSLRRDGEVNYDIQVMPIHEHEKNLDGGRFALFRRDAQPYGVELAYTRVYEAIAQRIGWIADTAVAPWSLDLRSEHACHATLCYSFARRGDAIKFKLAFGLGFGFAD